MRVIVLKSQLAAKGGLEKYTSKLLQALHARGCALTVLCTKAEVQGNFYRSIEMPKGSCINWRRLVQYDQWCQRWLKENPYDLVLGLERNSFQTHYRAGNGVHAHYLYLRNRTCPFWKRWSLFCNPMHPLLLQLEKKAYTHPQLQVLFTNSNMVRAEILLHYPTVLPEKLCVVHNGVEWHQWHGPFQESLQQRETIQRNLKMQPEAFQFLFVGHGFLRKGLQPLLRALSCLFRKGSRQWHLTVIGQDRHHATYVSMAQQLGLQKHVHFCSQGTSPLPFYQAADCVVIPSLYDPFANVTVEALAMGNFVVTSQYNGGKEVLNSNSGTVIEDLFDPASFAKALEAAMQRPKDPIRSFAIRESIKHLDFSQQLPMLLDRMLTPHHP